MARARLPLVLHWLVVGLLLALLPLRADDEVSLLGASQKHILDHYGVPTSRIKAGTKEVFNYPHGGRVVFQNGTVTAVTLPLPVEIRQLQDLTKPPPPAPTTTMLPSDTLTNSADKAPASPIDNMQDGFVWIGVFVLVLCLIGGGFKVWAKMTAHKNLTLQERFKQAQESVAAKKPPAPKGGRPPPVAAAGVPPAVPAAGGSPGAAPKVSSVPPPPRPPVFPVAAEGPPTMLSDRLLNEMEWRRLEMLVIEFYDKTGYAAKRVRVATDGTVDLHLYRRAEEQPFAYAQCKTGQVLKVGGKPVRDLLALMAAENIKEGYFITTSGFTTEALELAKGKLLTLISSADLIAMVNELPENQRTDVLRDVTLDDYTTPTCPNCDVKMVLQKTGRPVWACPNAPRCVVTMPVRSVTA